MAEVIWTEPALSDLDTIADYSALDNPEAAKLLVHTVFRHVEQLADHPKSGSKPQELKGWRYRQIVELPYRVFYRQEVSRVFIPYVMRSERLLRPSVLAASPMTRSKDFVFLPRQGAPLNSPSVRAK